VAKRDGGKRDRTFWGNLPEWSAEFAAAAIDRHEAHQEHLKRSKRHDRIRRMWSTVFMRGKNGACDETEIGSGGRRGETLFVTPNRLGRLVRDHVTMVVQTKSLPDPMAANSDAASQDQVALSKGIIEHYKREADLEGVKAERAFVAEICGDSYLHVPWDPDLGNEVAWDDQSAEETEPSPDDEAVEVEAPSETEQPEDDEEPQEPQGRVVYEGDFRFSVRTPYDVSYERQTAERKRPRWWIVEEPTNRYDLLTQVEEEVQDEKTKAKLIKAIMDAEPWSERLKVLNFDEDQDKYDDCIPLLFVYIERCRACPAGRFAKVIDAKTVFLDSPMLEPRAPVFRLSQGEVLFRNEPTTPNHDGLPLADALTGQLSTILSNHANYGMQRVIAPKEANLAQAELDSGAAVVNYQHVDKAGHPIPPPMPWSVGPGNPELFAFYAQLAGELDLVAAGSPVTRGDANATKGDSGSKVAALFAAAQNVASSFVAAVLRSEEELYTFIIDSLKRHATSKRVVSIVGEHNTFQAREYTSEKLSNIVRVAVQQADATRDTLQGRMAMVELLDGKTPDQQRQIIAIMRTGLPDPIADEMEPARILLERENEALRDPEQDMPVVMPNDPHAEHWRSHMNLLNTPDARRDKALYDRIIAHARGHVAALDPMSPDFAGNVALAMTNQKPLPTAQPEQNPNPPPPLNPEAKQSGDEGAAPQPPGQPRQLPGDIANAPRMPINPISGERMNAGGVGQPVRPQTSPAGLGA
jgi:hypothetical protein